jgi:hypothetical protein
MVERSWRECPHGAFGCRKNCWNRGQIGNQRENPSRHTVVNFFSPEDIGPTWKARRLGLHLSSPRYHVEWEGTKAWNGETVSLKSQLDNKLSFIQAQDNEYKINIGNTTPIYLRRFGYIIILYNKYIDPNIFNSFESKLKLHRLPLKCTFPIFILCLKPQLSLNHNLQYWK